MNPINYVYLIVCALVLCYLPRKSELPCGL